ncbi:MAG: polysaccharide biosynthesis C-terminal domain-containing protein [Ruminococcus sp.]|nr:polysaccharide biosynthesis C-terminal domain-containing protein [Ruminococcus sp.]
MNKYKFLAMNTIVFTIGSFGSKIISLLLNNLYTKNISPPELFTKSMLETLSLFLVPVFTFSITESIIRFGLDKNYDKKTVFSTGAVLNFLGLLPMVLIVPFIPALPFFKSVRGYMLLLMIYITTSSIRALCSQFVRAREMVKLFAFDGMLTTFMLLLFNLLFISHFGMGVRGFMLSTILSDLFSACFLFISARLKDFFSLKCFSKEIAVYMLRFSIPLVPTIVMWTFTGFSDQIFIGNMHSKKVFIGEDAAGIYSAASKIPNLISMLSTIFMQAWNMSAISENEAGDRNVFYEKVYSAYESVLFIGAAGLLLLIKPVTAILINYSVYPEYSTAYRYTPLLIAAAVYTCLDLFLASIYTATKHTKNAFLTIVFVSVLNIFLNLLFIPVWGMQGAAIATFSSYLLCFWVRIVDARHFVPFKFNAFKNIINTALLLLICAFTIFEPRLYILPCLLITAVISLINFKPLLVMVMRLLGKGKGSE